MVLHITNLGKDQDSKSEVHFILNVYHFHTIIKSKNGMLDHPKLGTIGSKALSTGLTQVSLL